MEIILMKSQEILDLHKKLHQDDYMDINSYFKNSIDSLKIWVEDVETKNKNCNIV